MKALNKAVPVLLLALACIPAASQAQGGVDGFYAGGNLGYAWGKDKGQEYDDGSVTSYSQFTKAHGTTFGVFAGRNWVQSNNLVLGVEAELESRSQKGNSAQLYSGVPDSDYPTQTKIQAAAALKLRAGYAFNEQRTLAYVTGGFALAQIKTTFEDLMTEPPSSQSDTQWKSGWTLGAGVEHNFTDALAARLEYSYADYGHRDVSTDQVYGSGREERQKLTDQTLKVGLIYRF